MLESVLSNNPAESLLQVSLLNELKKKIEKRSKNPGSRLRDQGQSARQRVWRARDL